MCCLWGKITAIGDMQGLPGLRRDNGVQLSMINFLFWTYAGALILWAILTVFLFIVFAVRRCMAARIRREAFARHEARRLRQLVAKEEDRRTKGG